MRWVTKVEAAPKNGDIRCRVQFAWKPIEVGRFTVWLERYEVWERYFAPAGGGPGWWSETVRKPLCVYY